MDFRNRKYYAIGRYGHNADIPKKLKKYFHCKIRCNQYTHREYHGDLQCIGCYYTHCVSIDCRDADRLVAFLKDMNVGYEEITREPVRKSYYEFYIGEDKQDISEKIKKAWEPVKKVEEMNKQINMERYEMLDFMTQVTDLKKAVVFIAGQDKDGSMVTAYSDNKMLMSKFREMCFECLKKYKED